MTQQEPALEATGNGRGTYTVTEAAELIGISCSTAYECVKSDNFRLYASDDEL